MPKLSIGQTMPRRLDRLDFWSFRDKTPIYSEPCPLSDSRTNEIICYLEKGDVLNLHNYIQNEYGIWGWYKFDRLHKHYVWLYDNSGFRAIHNVIQLDD